MTDTEIAELEAELRLHKEERLRLRALEMRLSRELDEARTLLADIQTDQSRTAFDGYGVNLLKPDIIRRIKAFLGQR